MLITVQPHLEYGGAERQTVLLANTLSDRGSRTAVVLHEAKGGLLPELDPAVDLVSLGLENHLLTPLVARRLARTLAARFAGPPRSLVVLHLWSSLLAGRLAERSRPGPFTFVYYEDLDPSDHADFIRLGRLKQRLIRQVFRHSAVVVANTHGVAEAMVRAYGLDRRPRVISPAVDLRALRAAAVPARSSVPDRTRPVRIATVGSLIPRKGLHLVYEGLLASGIECEWHVIGEGPQREWLASLPEDGRVAVRPHGSSPRPFELVAEMDLMVHGAHSEAFGIVLLEAMGVGTPVVSAAATGPREIAQVLGNRPDILRLFPVGDADALARAVRERVATLSTTPALDEMQRHIGRYSIEATADAWTELAQDLRCDV